MVTFISSWAQGIVVAVIIATIIEMIAPEGHSKKYIKVVIGIYVLFQIVSPVLEKVTNKSFAISSIVNWENDSNTMQSNQSIAQTLENVNQSNVQEIYVSSLQADIKTKIQEKGYMVKEIQIEVDNQTEGYPLKKIQLQLENKEKTKEEQTKSEDSKRVTINEIMNIEIMVHKDKSIKDEQTQQTKKLTTQEEKELKTYLSDIYSINAKYITIT